MMDPRTPGTKLDDGKLLAGIVLGGFARSLREVCRVGTFGARKYTDGGWVAVPNGVARYTDAMYRHLIAEALGEEDDAESGWMHAAHAAWNALARLDLILREREKATAARDLDSATRDGAPQAD